MKKTFWDHTSKIYNRFMRKDHKVSKQMDSLIYPVGGISRYWIVSTPV